MKSNNNLQDKAMLVYLSICFWAGKKYDKKVSEKIDRENNTNKAGRYLKYLIDQDEIKKIQKAANKARIFHYENTLPWIRKGQDILTSAIYFDYIKEMNKLKSDFENTVNDFLNNWDDNYNKAKSHLNGLFNPNDYPHVNQLRNKFSFSVSVSPIPVSDDFRLNLGADEIAKIRTEITDSLKAAEISVHRELWERLYKVVEPLIKVLPDNKAIFRDSLIGNIAHLVELFPKLNYNNDAQLENMRKEIESHLAGINPQRLRDDTKFRQETVKTAQKIIENMSGYM